MINILIQMGRTGATLPEMILVVVVFIVVLTFSLSIHEIMHGYMAYRLGDDTAKLQGRLTMNPLAHLDPIGTLMMILAGFGWAKPVPINYGRLSRFKNRSVSIRLVSLAGVGANFVVAFIAYFLNSILMLIAISNPDIFVQGSFLSTIFSFFLMLFQYLYRFNLLLMAFNLLPIPPLDGYRFIETFFPYKFRQTMSGYERYASFIFLGLILLGNFSGFSPLFSLVEIVQIPFNYIITTPIDALFRLFGG